MDVIFPVLSIVVVLLVSFFVHRKYRKERQIRFLTHYEFPSTIKNKVLKTYPHLGDAGANQVMRGLRDYFHLLHMADDESVAMPSQAVDVAWHEFILFTREYEQFCDKAFGRFIHHTPAEAVKSPMESQVSIKRAWELSCVREKISHFNPKRLPLIFALDAKYQISDGFYYELDCSGTMSDLNQNDDHKVVYCASHISISADFAPMSNGKPVSDVQSQSSGAGCSGSGMGCSGGCSGGS